MTQAETRPLSVVFEPEPGESFDGYLARHLACAPLRDRKAVLTAIGVSDVWIGPGRLEDSPASLQAVANLLQQPVSTIAQLNMSARHRQKFHVLLDFHGAWVARKCFLNEERRVSVSALRRQPVHLAMWTLRMMSLDGQSLEPLLTHCPVCQRVLGWRRSVRATHCDHCVDTRGRPSVDLRDFLPEPLQLKNDEGYRFLHALVDPLAAVDSRPLMAPEWREAKRGVQFEVALTVARWIAQKTHRGRLAGFSPTTFQMLTPEVMAEAGWAVRSGPEGLRAVEAEYLSDDEREVLGRVISRDPLVSASAKELVAGALQPSRPHMPRPRYESTHWLAEKFDVDVSFARRLANLQEDKAATGTRRLVKLDERIEPLISTYRHRVDTATLRSVMEFGSLDVRDLVEIGVFEPLEAALLGEKEGNCITGQSLAAARERLESRAISSLTAPSFREIWKARPDLSLGILFAAIATSDLVITRRTTVLPCWLDEFGTDDQHGLDQAISQVWAANPALAKGIFRRVGLKKEQGAVRFFPDGKEYANI